MLKKLANVVFSNDDVDLNDIDDIVAFFSDSMGLVATDVNNINFDDDTFDEFDLLTLFFLDLLLGVIYLNNVKHVEKR